MTRNTAAAPNLIRGPTRTKQTPDHVRGRAVAAGK